MTTAVKIFAHQGLVAAATLTTSQDTKDSVFMLAQPYLAREALTAGGVAVSSSAATAPNRTNLLSIEVADGGTIRYEANPPGRSVAADSSSPSLSGKNQIMFGKDWTLSVIEA